MTISPYKIQNKTAFNISRRYFLYTMWMGTLSGKTLSNSKEFPIEDFGGFPDGTDTSSALTAALSVASQVEGTVVFNVGVYVFATSPGLVVDAQRHNVPAVMEKFISIRGRGEHLTTFRSIPRRTPADMNVDVSSPIFNFRGALSVYISGITFDGGIHTISARGRPRSSPDPNAASLIEIRDTNFCLIDDVTITGFLGHSDNRDIDPGSFGRRGIALFSNVDFLSLNGIHLAHPTYREGVFIHNCNDIMVNKFNFSGPCDLGSGGLSTPLHVIGTKLSHIMISDFKTNGAWSGSLLNLGGPGVFHIRNLHAKGRIDNYSTYSSSSTKSTKNTWGKGIDCGAEINLNHSGTKSLILENIFLKDCFSYSIRINRTKECPLENLVLLKNVVIDGGFNALFAENVNNINGNIIARRIRDYAARGRRSGIIVFRNCKQGSINVDLEGDISSENLIRRDPENLPTKGGLGLLRVNSNKVWVSGKIHNCDLGAIFNDISNNINEPSSDALYRNLFILHDFKKNGPAVYTGRSKDLKIRTFIMEKCFINGESADKKIDEMVIYSEYSKIS